VRSLVSIYDTAFYSSYHNDQSQAIVQFSVGMKSCVPKGFFILFSIVRKCNFATKISLIVLTVLDRLKHLKAAIT
jgi:hypothetical protein